MAFGPAATAASYRCRNHPDREGVGVCVRCRGVVCMECSTRVDRMNFCTSCLTEVSTDGPSAGRRPMVIGPNPFAGVLCILASYAALVGLFLLGGLLLATLQASMRPG